MKNGYDQFFKNARQIADQQSGTKPRKKPTPATQLKLNLESESVEAELRRRMKMAPIRKRKKAQVPWKMIGVSFVGFVVCIFGFQNYEAVEDFIKRVEIQVYGSAMAQSAPPAAVPKPAAKVEEKKPATPAMSSVEVDHLKKLNDRKKELDAREEELNRLESELQTQKIELDKRLKDLEEMRTKISQMLEQRVKADDQKVDTLVQMYSNMKAPQAAKVFETMDEDLAIEILGRMKKKSAADIMNLLPAEKAQTLSEMFAGYKRRTPASE